MGPDIPVTKFVAGLALLSLACAGAVAMLPPGVAGGVVTDAIARGATAGPDPHPTATPRPTARPTATSTPATTTAATPTANANGLRRYSYTAGEGPTATRVTVIDAERPGPTVVVVGGQHGNEPAGYRAAHRVEEWEISRGTLVVVPEANPRAIANGTRKVDGRDLNAQFPVGKRPTSEQARVIWGVLERHDADVVIDLHSSTGIYGVDGGVGQAVFPTVTGDAVDNADAAIDRVNGRFGLTGNYSFRRGNVMGRTGMSLTRKVAGDLNGTAYIVETTKRGTDLETRVEWTTAVTWELLRLHGLVEGDPPARVAEPHASLAVAGAPE